jgi:hypothetical protein
LTTQVYANGHDFVVNKLDGLGLGYVLADNVFVALEDFQREKGDSVDFACLWAGQL